MNHFLFYSQVYMGQLRNKCVLNVPASANWSSWVNNDKHWFIVEGNPELCGNASGARYELRGWISSTCSEMRYS
jgi:hypothetical protein